MTPCISHNNTGYMLTLVYFFFPHSVDILLYYLRHTGRCAGPGHCPGVLLLLITSCGPPWPFLAFFLFMRPGRPPQYRECKEKSMCS